MISWAKYNYTGGQIWPLRLSLTRVPSTKVKTP